MYLHECADFIDFGLQVLCAMSAMSADSIKLLLKLMCC